VITLAGTSRKRWPSKWHFCGFLDRDFQENKSGNEAVTTLKAGANKRRTLAVAMIGHGFMGRAHSNAWRQAPRFFDLPAEIRMKTICGRNRRSTQRAAESLGWENSEVDWKRAVADPAIDIIDICTSNDTHAEIAIAAARAGKAILCEKPLARSVREARQMWHAVRKARATNMICHNYRRVPAIALAARMIERGDLGDRLYHFRARYAQDWLVDPKSPASWRLRAALSGSGALGDIFSHAVDLGRFLVGEFRDVSAQMATFIKQRPAHAGGRVKTRVDVDDAVNMIGHFRNGALASIEATRFASGRKNALSFEINGSLGSLAFDLENLNVLRFFSRAGDVDAQGFREIIVTEPSHPYSKQWWPPGHLIGYEHTFVHTIAVFFAAAAMRKSAEPNFEDGLRNQRVLEAVAKSARTHRQITVQNRD
jgi:predicted dehydrogenase